MTGEKIVTTGAIVQFVVKIRTLPFKKDGTLLSHGLRSGFDLTRRTTESDVRPSSEEDEEAQQALIPGKAGKAATDKEGRQAIGFARAPRFLEERKPQWWVTLADAKQSRIIVQPSKCTDVGPDHTRTFSVQFQAPPQAGLYSFRAIVKSDVFLGSEADASVLLKIDDASKLEDADFEDDISDPEEDTLAGQMAAMRGEKVKPSAAYRDDDDSSTDADEEEQEAQDSDSDWD